MRKGPQNGGIICRRLQNACAAAVAEQSYGVPVMLPSYVLAMTKTKMPPEVV
jgi:hypothetical protein